MDTDMQALIRSSHKDDFPAVDYFIHRKESGELRTPDMVAKWHYKILHSDAVSGERVAVFSWDFVYAENKQQICDLPARDYRFL